MMLRMNVPRAWPRWWAAAVLAAWLSVGVAQPMRDPTLSPAAAGLGQTGTSQTGDGQQGLKLEPGVMAVVVRDGVHYLVLGTRLYAKDQTVGQARIVRITETEVWVREAGQLKKIPVFSGIERRAVKP